MKLLLVLSVIVLVACQPSPESQARMAADASIEYCWQEQSKKSWDPSTARQIASVCEKLERDRKAMR